MSNPEDIEVAAADWLVRRNQGLSPADEARFQDWLQVDPQHTATFFELQSAWSAVSYPGALGQSDIALRRLASLEHRRRNRRAVGVGFAVAILVAALVSVPWSHQGPAAESSIAFLPPGRQVLPDGSKVELNLGAQIEVDFSPGRRGVKLISGEAWFTVVKNAARPFVVSAEGVEVKAVGTEFTVRCNAQQVDVMVTQGKVALKRSHGDEDLVADSLVPAATDANDRGLGPPILAAGQRAVISVSPVPTAAAQAVTVRGLSASELGTALAWRRGRVKFSRTHLSDAIKVFNHRDGIQITISDPEVARLPLSGTLQIGEPESFVRLLEKGFGLHAVRTGGAIDLRRNAL